MQDKVMTFGDIYVAPFEFTNLQSLKVVKQFNEHVHLKITGIIPEEKKDSYAELTDGHGQMRVSLNNESGEPKYWFRGVVTQVSIKSVRGIYYLTAHAVSHSYLLDIEKKKRSFQNPYMSYAGLVRSVLSDYAGLDFIHCASKDEVLGTLAMQYEETDWQFLKRMASRFYTGLMPAAAFDTPKLFFGLPDNQSKGELKAVNYTVQKRSAAYKQAVEHRIPGIREQDYVVYEVQSERVLDVGDEVVFKSRTFVVGEAVTEWQSGLLMHTYALYPRAGLKQRRLYNQAIIGASIQGRVLQVRKDQVRAKLDMDDQQDESTAYWFPYSTIYASENNTGWYVMPEVNDQIRIYFPSKKEEEGIAISSVVKQKPEARPAPVVTSNGSAGRGTSMQAGGFAKAPDRMVDPAIKTLRTKYGKEIMLAPDKIVFSSGGMSITISDDSGIDIVSDQNVNITAGGGDIQLSSRNLRIQADKVELTGNGNTITMEDKVELKGAEVKMN